MGKPSRSSLKSFDACYIIGQEVVEVVLILSLTAREPTSHGSELFRVLISFVLIRNDQAPLSFEAVALAWVPRC